jgi:hypothetical protein
MALMLIIAKYINVSSPKAPLTGLASVHCINLNCPSSSIFTLVIVSVMVKVRGFNVGQHLVLGGELGDAVAAREEFVLGIKWTCNTTFIINVRIIRENRKAV